MKTRYKFFMFATIILAIFSIMASPALAQYVGNMSNNFSPKESFFHKPNIIKNQTVPSTPTIIGFDDFEFEMKDDNGIFTDNMVNPGILEAGRQYHVIQKVEFEQKDLPTDGTKVNGTVGYAFHHGDKMIGPPMGENVTYEEQQEFMRNLLKSYEEFRKTSTIKDSYEFTAYVEKPFYIKFPIKFEQIGLYTYQFYQKTDLKEGPGGASMGGLVVVEKYSKALDEDGLCRTEGLTRTIKYDYSTIACTTIETHHELRDRGWGLK